MSIRMREALQVVLGAAGFVGILGAAAGLTWLYYGLANA